MAAAALGGVEGVAAAAGGLGVRVLDRETAAHQVVLVVAVGGLVEDHAVGETGAAAALDVDPEPALGDVLLLLLQDALDLLGRVRREGDHYLRSPRRVRRPLH